MKGLLTVSDLIPASEVGPEMSEWCQMENWNSWLLENVLSYFYEAQWYSFIQNKNFWKTGTHCGTSSSKPEQALVIFASLISMSFAKVSLFRSSFAAISASHPICSHGGGQPHQALLQRSSSSAFLFSWFTEFHLSHSQQVPSCVENSQS